MSYIGNTPTTQSFIAGTDQFTGNGSSTSWTLSRLVNSSNDIEVVIANVIQNPTSYSVSGNTLTISPAIGNAVAFYVRYLTTTLQSFAPSQGTVGISQLSATGTPSTTTFLRGDNTWSLVAGFDSGTLMLFQQTNAPTGWTKQTTHNNKALRVVSGVAGSGGSITFTAAFTSQAVGGTVGSTTLSTSQIPSHVHGIPTGINRNTNSSVAYPTMATAVDTTIRNTFGEGGGGSHNHTFTGTALDLAVQYVDLIIASKD